jgi:hypothetical protein
MDWLPAGRCPLRQGPAWVRPSSPGPGVVAGGSGRRCGRRDTGSSVPPRWREQTSGSTCLQRRSGTTSSSPTSTYPRPTALCHWRGPTVRWPVLAEWGRPLLGHHRERVQIVTDSRPGTRAYLADCPVRATRASSQPGRLHAESTGLDAHKRPTVPTSPKPAGHQPAAAGQASFSRLVPADEGHRPRWRMPGWRGCSAAFTPREPTNGTTVSPTTLGADLTDHALRDLGLLRPAPHRWRRSRRSRRGGPQQRLAREVEGARGPPPGVPHRGGTQPDDAASTRSCPWRGTRPLLSSQPVRRRLHGGPPRVVPPVEPTHAVTTDFEGKAHEVVVCDRRPGPRT